MKKRICRKTRNDTSAFHPKSIANNSKLPYNKSFPKFLWCFVNNVIISYLLFSILCVQTSLAACPTLFIAQSISQTRAAMLDIHHTISDISSAADCANYCGVRLDCVSAVYNHDARICSLSTKFFMECSLSKQRYSTFHLKTDGAEALSIITCIDPCKNENRFSADPSKKRSLASKFSAIVPDIITKNDDNYNALDSKKISSEGQTLEIFAKSRNPSISSSTNAQLFSNKLLPLTPIIPVNYPVPQPLPADIINAANILNSGSFAHSVDEGKENNSMEQSNPTVYSSHGNSNFHSVGYLNSPQYQKMLREIVGGHIKVDDSAVNQSEEILKFDSIRPVSHQKNDETLEFLRAIQQLNWIQKKMSKLQDKRQHDQHKDHAGVLHGEDIPLQQKTNVLLTKMNPIFDRKILFKAQPLQLQEMIRNSANAQEAALRVESNNNTGNPDATQSNYKDAELTGSSGSIKTMTNGSESNVHSGGFIALLTPPTEPLKLFNGENYDHRSSTGLKHNIDESVENTVINRMTKISAIVTTTTKLPKVKKGDINMLVPSEPIVVNGKILSPKEKLELMRRERTSSTTTTTAVPWQPAGLIGESSLNEPEIVESKNSHHGSSEADEYFKSSIKRRGPTFDDDNGFLNTFVIHGISSLMNKHHDEHSADDINKKEKHLSTPTITTTTTGPVICFRSIAQQSLLHASFKTFANVTLNECRCKCADTWINSTKSTMNLERCKSLQFDEKNGNCVMNEADHNGKYDLIYDKHVDYYYVSCQIDQLVNTAKRKCKAQQRSKNFKTDLLQEHLVTKIDQNTTSVSTSLPTRSKSTKTTEIAVNTTTTTTTTAKTTTITEKAAIMNKSTSKKESGTTQSTVTTRKISSGALEHKPMEKIEFNHPTTPTTKNMTQQYNKILKKEEVIEKPAKNYVDEAQIQSGKHDDNINKIVNTARTESTLFVFSKSSKSTTPTRKTVATDRATPSTVSSIISRTNSKKLITTTVQPKTVTKITVEQTSTAAKTSNLTTTKPSTVDKTVNVRTNKCFEVIDGYAINSTAGGLEQDVTLEECQCFCVNSLLSGRYAFQCTSATYYHKEKDCILNLSNRQLNPRIFVANPLQNESDSQITYLGLICNSIKAVEQNPNQQCQKRISAYDERSTTTLSTSTDASHSDDCFMELPNYILEGIALAIETNVTVEECKCYCVDSENRYGSICQSLQYYFDSQTCLLNKENRITNPDQFTYDQASNVMHSYFDYRCHVEKVTLSVYVEQVCQIVTQLSINDLFKPKSPSLNIDAKSNEARSIHAFEDDPKKIEYKTNDEANKKLLQNNTSKKNFLPVSPQIQVSHFKKTPAHSSLTSKMTPTTTQVTTLSKKTKTSKFKNKSEEALEDETKIISIQSGITKKKPKIANESDVMGKGKPPVVKSKNSDEESEYEDDEDNDDKNDANNFEEENQKTREKSTTNSQKLQKFLIPELEEFDDSHEKNHSSSNGNVYEPITQNLIIQPTKMSNSSVEPITTTTTIKSTNSQLLVSSTPSSISNSTEVSSEEAPKFQYPNVGPCQYSALYQTVFNGVRLIKRLMVSSPAQCFAACHAERCRSANMIQIESNLKYCELFRDSIVDFRRTDVLGFDRGAVHFDSIQCESSET